MNSSVNNRIFVIFLLAVGFLVSACGTLEVGLEPTVAKAEATIKPTQADLPPTKAPSPVADAEVVEEPTMEPIPAVTVEEQGAENEIESRLAQISTIDDTWLKYTNYDLGFSINFPRVKTHLFGACVWNEENGDHSYRPRYALVPVQIFEDGSTVYISSEYQHVLSGETKDTSEDGGTRIFYSQCEAVPNSLELLRDPEIYQEMWAIVVEDIQSDEQLDAFLKERYGAGCRLGEKVASEQAGVYNIVIEGDGKGLPDSACPINFGTVVKYYPEDQKVAAWDTGQAYTFSADVNNEVTRDQEMVDSFRFLVRDNTTSATAESDIDQEGLSEYDYSGWKAYSNEDIGYSLMVPKNVEVISLDPNQSVQFNGPEGDGVPWPMFTIEHWESSIPEGTDFRQELVEAYADFLETTDSGFRGLVEELTIAGVPAIRFRYPAMEGSGARDDYFFIVRDLMVRVAISHAGGMEDWAMYDQFLQSIDFDTS